MEEHEGNEEIEWVEPNEDWYEFLGTKGSANGSGVEDATVELHGTFILDDGGEKDDVMEGEVEMGKVMAGRERDVELAGRLGSEGSKAWLGNSQKRKRLASGGWPGVELGRWELGFVKDNVP